MSPLRIVGVVLVCLAVVTSLFLGTFGWFAMGFATMTDCTNDYSCSASSCEPCRATALLINGGGVAQLVLAGSGIVLGVVGWRVPRRGFLAWAGLALLAVSVATFAGTSALARDSYCEPGSSGYRESYCDVG